MRMVNLIIGIILLIIISASIFFGIFADWIWFSSVGYQAVYAEILLTSIELGIIAFVVFFLFSFAVMRLSARAAAGKGRKKGRKHAQADPRTRALYIVSGIIGLAIAASVGSQWQTVLKYMNSAAFGASDAVFGLDIGFYVFTLPFYSLILNFLLAMFVLSAILAVASYVSHSIGFKMEMVETEEEQKTDFFGGTFGSSGPHKQVKMKWSGSWQRFVPIISVLLFLIFAVIAGQIWLAQYGLLYASGGAVYGAGYTDVNITLPLLTVLSVVSFVIALLFLGNIRIKKARFIRDGVVAFVVIAVLGVIITGAVQALVVRPNEFNLEQPFIERNIQATLAAYGLDDIRETAFPVTYNLTSRDIQNNPGTIGNIRIWDWRPLKQTYSQLQLFRTYYDFRDVDIDRYMIDGELRQVMMSAREMNPSGLQRQAQTWVNQHLVYTHGYGVVMNPVDQVSSEGLPVFLMKDIPVSSDYIDLEQPRLYYSEGPGRSSDYVITGTDTDELDFPSGDQNIYTPYAGTGGVQMSDFLMRLTFAIRFRSIELLVSGSIQPGSKLLMNRNVADRASTIAPFLLYDDDPYIVVSDGRLYWIIDAYTVTDKYPYSQPVWYTADDDDGTLNYIRNSVKVVVDAYNGDVSYYVVDDTDPMVNAYQKMFPALFRPFSDMPDSLKSHVRYPEDLFDVQAAIYSTYHMKDPRVFYNKEDVWVVPDEIYRGSRQKVIPYYIIMSLPEEDNEEFILMIPFTPKGKQNMIGWMAARSDQPNYGKLVVYQFSKQELTYGPMQIEARIDQDPDISQLITLWSQSGSDVLRGNTLIIPIEDSILYIEPLYLEATEEGTLPQLQRVIVSYGDRLTMQDSLDEALDVLFGTGTSAKPSVPGEPGTGEPPIQLPGTAEEKLAEIADLFNKAQDALADGNLGLYQQYIDEIGVLAAVSN
jgi:uncharacterized membrane protein (UPF0182 family)